MKPKINVITGYDHSFLSRQEPSGTGFLWQYSNAPVEADWHVVVGQTAALAVPNCPHRTILVIAEPPEIVKYSNEYLKQFGLIVGPNFRYMRSFPSFFPRGGVVPWRAGIEYSQTSSGQVTLYRKELEKISISKSVNFGISMIVSEKSSTPFQIARLKLAEYLSRHIRELDVFGAGINAVQDTADVFLRYPITVAVENSSHPLYWSEKLSDPLIFMNRVAYGGHPVNVKPFHSSAVLRINPFNPKSTREALLRWAHSEQNPDSEKFMQVAKREILNRRNFHHVISSLLGQQDCCDKGKSESVLEPNIELRGHGHLRSRAISLAWSVSVNKTLQRLRGTEN